MFLKSIKLRNFLSFGDTDEEIKMENLNVIIGANGSGKSNFIEAINLFCNAPRDISYPIRKGGGVDNWIWKGKKSSDVAEIEAIFCSEKDYQSNLRYILNFLVENQHFKIQKEKLESEDIKPNHKNPYIYYSFENGYAVLNHFENDESGEQEYSRKLKEEQVEPNQSVFSQFKDPVELKELTYLANMFEKIKIYRDWSFGNNTSIRSPQPVDLPNSSLLPDMSNLGLVLNKLRQTPPVKKELLKELQDIYKGIEDYDVNLESGTVQIFLHEEEYSIPAVRLSDGTLRYLALLAILCNPNPLPIICIEEPELGMHPDVLPAIARLLKKASEHCQLIVTTHSEILVNCFTETPEVVMVAERDESGTHFERLNSEDLKYWLDKEYGLGKIWSMGEVGGNRW